MILDIVTECVTAAGAGCVRRIALHHISICIIAKIIAAHLGDRVFVRGVVVRIRLGVAPIRERAQVADLIVIPRLRVDTGQCRVLEPVQVIVIERGHLGQEVVGDGLDIANLVAGIFQTLQRVVHARLQFPQAQGVGVVGVIRRDVANRRGGQTILDTMYADESGMSWSKGKYRAISKIHKELESVRCHTTRKVLWIHMRRVRYQNPLFCSCSQIKCENSAV